MNDAEPLDVECPECGAPEGRACRGGSMHFARLEFAENGPVEADDELADLLDLHF